MSDLPTWLQHQTGLAVALAVALAIGLLLAWRIAVLSRWLRAWWSRWRGRRGETRAVALLNAAGYRISGEQSMQRCSYTVDGVEITYVVRADYIVTRDGQRFVAEVKNGEQAADPRNRATRRQLLEYGIVFAVDGVLLVDVPQRRVRRIEFPRM